MQFTALPYDSIDVPFEWVVPAPYGTIYAEIENSSPPEFNEFNNSTHIEFGDPVPPLIPNIIIPSSTICLGDTVTLSVDPSGGLGNYYYTWTSTVPGFVASTSSITVIPDETTTYTCVVEDGFHSSQAVATITVIDLGLDLGSDFTMCGDGTETLDAGVFDTYLWSTQETTQTIEITDGGTYSVEVEMTNFGCTASDTIQVSMYPEPDSETMSYQRCNTDSVTHYPVRGVGYSYQWSDNTVADTLVMPQAGTYYGTITDQNGCTTIDTIQLSVSIVTVDLGPDQTVCNGQSVILDAGGGNYFYDWSVGASSQTIVVTQTDTIIVWKSNAYQCVASDTVVITFVPSLTVSLGGTAELCEGQTLTLDPGVYSTYLWNDQSTNQTLTVDTAGNYFVTVYDQSGCSGTANVYVSVTAVPDTDIPDQVLCEGGEFTYTVYGATDVGWSTGSVDSVFNTAQAGDYAVTIYYGSCFDTDSFNVSIVSMPLDLGPSQSICEGESVILDAGANFLSYSWSNAATSQTVTVNEGDTYSVTVTGANQCVAEDSVTIYVLPLPQLQISPYVTLCAGSFVTLTPGTFNGYSWSDQSTGSSLTVSAPGTYSVTVVDQNGCSNSDSSIVTESPLPVIDLGPDTTICEGSQVLLDVGGMFVSQTWSTQETSSYIYVGSSGNFSVTVTDQNGCSGNDMIAVTVLPLSIDLGSEYYLCPGATVTLDAGVYETYLWSTNDTTQSITVNQAGNYSLTVTSSNGCSAGDEVYVHQVANPSIELGPDIELCEGNQTIIYADNYASYSWNTGATTPSITVDTAGIYSLTVTNTHGCENSDQLTVTINPLPTVSFNGLNLTYCTNNDHSILVGVPTGGTFTGTGVLGTYFEPYTLNPGTYQVSYNYTDTNGCFNSLTKTTIVYDIPVVSFTGLDVEYFSDAANDTLTGIPGGGVFSGTGMTDSIFSPVTAGVGTQFISYMYTDTNGCYDTYIQSTLVSTVYNIFGLLVYDNTSEDPLPGSVVQLNNAAGAPVGIDVSDQQGAFEYTDKHNGTYHVDVTTAPLFGGITATDALKIRRHVVFLETLGGLNLDVADVNNSNTITSADALFVLRRTVNLVDTFPAGNWVFEDPDIIISNADVNVTVKGLCYGDVNASYSFGGSKQFENFNSLSREGSMLIAENKELHIPVYISDAVEIGALTWVMNFNSDHLEISEILCNAEGFVYNISGNEIRIAFENIDGIIVDGSNPLISLVGKLIGNSDEANNIILSPETEVANVYGDIMHQVSFNIPKLSSSEDESGFSLENNYPNPFRDRTTITYTIPENGNVKLSIVNLLGEELEVLVNNYNESGTYSIDYDARLLSSGMYMYKLEVEGESQDFNATGTMQIIK